MFNQIKFYNNFQQKRNNMPKTHTIKVCAICGKAEGRNWAYHWKTQHPDSQIQKLALGDLPSNPFKKNWLDLIEPEELREKI
jgi:hypothetical protein